MFPITPNHPMCSPYNVHVPCIHNQCPHPSVLPAMSNPFISTSPGGVHPSPSPLPPSVRPARGRGMSACVGAPPPPATRPPPEPAPWPDPPVSGAARSPGTGLLSRRPTACQLQVEGVISNYNAYIMDTPQSPRLVFSLYISDM